MNDDDLTTILRRGDESHELPADAAGRIQAKMHDELDGALGNDAAVLSLHQSNTVRGEESSPISRRRSLMWIAAAVLLVAGGMGIIYQRQPNIYQATQPPPQQPYLAACVEFIGSTSIGEQTWSDLLANPTASIPPEYLAALATAIDELLATNPEARTATSQLQAAALEARANDFNPELIIRQLELSQDILFEKTATSCLTTNDRDEDFEDY